MSGCTANPERTSRGLEESADGVWSLYLGPVLLWNIDEPTLKVFS